MSSKTNLSSHGRPILNSNFVTIQLELEKNIWSKISAKEYTL